MSDTQLENLRVLAYESIKSFVALFAFIFTFISNELKDAGEVLIKIIILSAQHSGPLPSFSYYIFADGDGVVVVPKDIVVPVLEKAEKNFNDEKLSRRAMAEGMDPFEVYNKYGRF